MINKLSILLIFYFLCLSAESAPFGSQYALPDLASSDQLRLTEGAADLADEGNSFNEVIGQKIEAWYQQKASPTCFEMLKGLKNLQFPEKGPTNEEANKAFDLIAGRLNNDLEKCRAKWAGAGACAAPIDTLQKEITFCKENVSMPVNAIYIPNVRAPEKQAGSYESLIAQIKKNRASKGWAAYIADLAKKSPVDLNTRSMLIFLDDREFITGGLAVTAGAIPALYQKASPILITGSLLSNIFRKTPIRLTSEEPKKGLTKEFLEAFNGLFDARAWTVKKLDGNDQFFLMIPSLNPKSEELGINVENFTTLPTDRKDSLTTYFSDISRIQKFSKNNPNLGKDFLNVLNNKDLDKKLFIPKSDYLKQNKAPINWVVYLIGHGMIGHWIADISIKNFEATVSIKDSGGIARDVTVMKNDFKTMLDFFVNEIQIKLFAYSSCYAAGLSAKEIYGDLLKDSSTYPFPIATEAITDAPIYSKSLVIYKKELLGILSGGGIDSEYNFNSFVTESKKDPINFEQTLKWVFPVIGRGAKFEKEIQNIPQIRPANTPAWFPIKNHDNEVIRIGRVMDYTRKGKDLVVKPYKVGLLSTEDPKAILLDTDTVNFKIIIDKSITKIPPFISTLPGKAAHIVESLQIDANVTKQDLVKALTANIEYGATKIFWFHTVRDNRGNTYENLIIEINGQQIDAYITEGRIRQRLFLLESGEEAKGIVTATYEKNYEKIVQEMMAKTGRFAFQPQVNP